MAASARATAAHWRRPVSVSGTSREPAKRRRLCYVRRVVIGAAADEKTRQMFADHRIGGKGEAKFLEPNPVCLLRQVADRGLCEKAIEDDPVKGRSIKVRRDSSGKEARAPRGNCNRRFGQGVVVEQFDFGS